MKVECQSRFILNCIPESVLKPLGVGQIDIALLSCLLFSAVNIALLFPCLLLYMYVLLSNWYGLLVYIPVRTVLTLQWTIRLYPVSRLKVHMSSVEKGLELCTCV